MAASWGAAAEPTEASIEKLLSLMKAETMVDSVYANLEAYTRQGIHQAVAGKQLSDEQRRALEGVSKKLMQIVQEEMNWSTLKPMYIRIYRESFDQEDIDGLNVFYASNAGQAYVNKMPIAMQKTMAAVQERMAPLLAKVTNAMKTAAEEAKLGK